MIRRKLRSILIIRKITGKLITRRKNTRTKDKLRTTKKTKKKKNNTEEEENEQQRRRINKKTNTTNKNKTDK